LSSVWRIQQTRIEQQLVEQQTCIGQMQLAHAP
jgi:hypothetical protein